MTGRRGRRRGAQPVRRRMTPSTGFRRRWPWVTADLQTIRNDLPGRLAGVPAESGQRFEIRLRDGSGDRLVARYHPGLASVPAVVLVPGLTGCEASRHVLQAAHAWVADGAPVVRLNLRGSPPGRSLAKGHYHMGRAGDLADACVAVGDLDPGIRRQGVVVVGFSLGGALALRLAQAPSRPEIVKAVVAVSAPLDLPATAARIARPRNRFYERWLLRRLKRETAPLWRHGPATVRAAVQAARHIRDFDDALTAKEAGFRRRGGLLRLVLSRSRHGQARDSDADHSRGRRSLGAAAVGRRGSGASRRRHARRRPCGLSWEGKPDSVVRGCCGALRTIVPSRKVRDVTAWKSHDNHVSRARCDGRTPCAAQGRHHERASSCARAGRSSHPVGSPRYRRGAGSLGASKVWFQWICEWSRPHHDHSRSTFAPAARS